MATIKMELELLNEICHHCECIINGQKVDKIEEKDLDKDIEIKKKDPRLDVPLYTHYQVQDDK